LKGTTLSNPPLIEAIFEAKWQPEEMEPGRRRDRHYHLLIGRLYDKLCQDYSYYEPLPAASVPSNLVAGVVQHRFRKDDGQWPVIQIGPGIFTVNDTETYTWNDFKNRVVGGMEDLFDVCPSLQDLTFDSLALRYINGVELDFDQEDILKFLEDQMRIDLSLPSSLFEDTSTEKAPLGIDCRLAFRCTKPKSRINMKFSRGRRYDSDALIWETIVFTGSGDMPRLLSGLENWLTEAHDVAEGWFFKLVEGDLLRSFK
jgi:uncharacterized protein (TIGR04255 family)